MEIIYKPNKKKLKIALIIYNLFIVVGFFITLKSDIFASTYFAKRLGILGTPISIQIIGVLTIVIMTLMFIGTIKLLFKNRILIVNDEGFINYTNFTNAGLILWKDVKDVRINRKKHNSLILIIVKDEKKYFNKFKNPIIKLNAITYKKAYNTSFVIETAYLKISEDDLMKIFKKNAKL